MGAKVKRLVFDTNIVISTLIFKSELTHQLRLAWTEGRLIPLISKETTEELIRVLPYPKFKLSPSEQETLRGEYLMCAEVCASIKKYKSNYSCRGPFDQRFIDLTLSSDADGLMTGDRALLGLQKNFPIPIYQLADLKNLI